MANQNLLEKNIISELGLDGLSEERKTGLINKISALVEKRITLRLMREIDDNKTEELNELSDKSNEAKMKFLQDNIPNMEDIIEEEIIKVKGDIIEESKRNNS